MANPENISIDLDVSQSSSLQMHVTSGSGVEIGIDDPHKIKFNPTEQDQEFVITFTIKSEGFTFQDTPITFSNSSSNGNNQVTPLSPTQASLTHTDGVAPQNEPQDSQFLFHFNLNGDPLPPTDPTIVDNPPPGNSSDEETS